MLEDRKIAYWRTGTTNGTETQIFLDLEESRTLKLGCVPSTHANPMEDAHVTQESLSNQGLQAGPPNRRRGGFFRVLFVVLQAQLHC